MLERNDALANAIKSGVRQTKGSELTALRNAKYSQASLTRTMHMAMQMR